MSFLRNSNAILRPKQNSIVFEKGSDNEPEISFNLINQELPKIAPEKEVSVNKLQLKNDTKDIILKYKGKKFFWYHEVIPNNVFLNKKLLTVVKYPYQKNKAAIVVKMKSNNAEAVKLLANTTIAYYYYGKPKSDNVYAVNLEKKPTDKKFNKSDFDINKNLSTEEQEKLYSLIKDYLDIFSFDFSQIGKTHLIKHDIELVEGAQPVRKRPYRVSLKEQE